MKILIFSPFSTDRAEKIMNSFIIQLVEKLKNDGLNIFNFIDSKFTKKRLMNEIKNVNPINNFENLAIFSSNHFLL